MVTNLARLTRAVFPRWGSRAWLVAGGYASFAAIWIYTSDSALALLSPDLVVRVSVYKGLAFVATTSLLLLLALGRIVDALEASNASLLVSEAELARAQRLTAALMHVNQAIARTPAEGELLEKICRILVEHGGFELVWIGWEDANSRRIVPSALAGLSADLAPSLVAYADDADGPARAMRDAAPVVCDQDPLLQRLPARDRDRLGASTALPLRRGGRVAGVVAVYAGAGGSFRERELALLTETAQDIEYALENLDRETERRKADAAAHDERLFSATMIESMPGVVYFYDELGGFLRWNQSFETTSGYSGAEIARMHPTDFFLPEDQPRIQARIEEVFAHGQSSVEAPLRAKDGRTTPHSFTGQRVLHKGRPCLVGVGIDVSERARAEEALRTLNQTLEAQVAERTVELRSALLRAESADRLKSAFLATMSHELRTPLNSIIGFSGILLQGMAGPLNDEQTTQLGMVKTSARHLLDLINDVLDLSTIEAGQLQVRRERVEVRAVIERVSQMIRPLATQKELSLNVEVDPAVPDALTSDRRRVEQILINLLNNAIKFTDRGGITLAVDVPATSLRFRVIDTGIGLSEEDLATLFLPFRQLDSGLTRAHEGTGLGLAICRRLAGLLGGEVSARGEPQRGSEFTLTLPLAEVRP